MSLQNLIYYTFSIFIKEYFEKDFGKKNERKNQGSQHVKTNYTITS